MWPCKSKSEESQEHDLKYQNIVSAYLLTKQYAVTNIFEANKKCPTILSIIKSEPKHFEKIIFVYAKSVHLCR